MLAQDTGDFVENARMPQNPAVSGNRESSPLDVVDPGRPGRHEARVEWGPEGNSANARGQSDHLELAEERRLRPHLCRAGAPSEPCEPGTTMRRRKKNDSADAVVGIVPEIPAGGETPHRMCDDGDLAGTRYVAQAGDGALDFQCVLDITAEWIPESHDVNVSRRPAARYEMCGQGFEHRVRVAPAGHEQDGGKCAQAALTS